MHLRIYSYHKLLLYTELWIGFTQLDYSGLEGDFVLPVVKMLSGRIAPGLTVAVRFQTAYIQATGEFPMCTKVLKSIISLSPCKAPSDFKQTDQILKFSSTNTSITVPVPLRSDSVYEHNEIFFCSLSHQPTRLNVHMYPDRTVLYIIDSTSMSTTHSSLMHTFSHSTIFTNSLLHFFLRL